MCFMVYSIPTPDDEEQRLENLKEYDILGSSPEIVFDEITELAAEILQCPVSTIQFMNCLLYTSPSPRD